VSCRPREQCSGAIMTTPDLDDFKPKNRASVLQIAIDRRQHGVFENILPLVEVESLQTTPNLPLFFCARAFSGQTFHWARTLRE
jgi:hypothetical protein